MNSRERLQATLAHNPVDRVCIDFGSTHVTGISASLLSQLRTRLLGESDYRVKIIEPYQMLGEVDDELMEVLGVDVVGIFPPKNLFGFENKDWKPFTMFDGTEVLVPGNFNVTPTEKGGWHIYPEGDTTVAPSGHMPEGGFYFDAICRQEPIVEADLDPANNLEEFGLLSESDLDYFEAEADRAIAKDKGTILTAPGTGFGDIALVPAMWCKQTRGIRDVQEWYMATAMRREYVHTVFQGQLEIALSNLDLLIKRLGDKIQAVFTTGADFGMQTGLFLSPQSYRELFMPYHKAINDFIHANSNWKVFIHSCGAVRELIPDLVEAGFDILNPMQLSAVGMDARDIKNTFGDDLTFWGGGVDTQQTLPFGTPEEVYQQVRERIEILNSPTGMVFNTIHNIQANTPMDNIMAMLKGMGLDV